MLSSGPMGDMAAGPTLLGQHGRLVVAIAQLE